MRYRWKPNRAEKNAYIEKMKEKESLNTFTTNKAIRNGCFVSFYSAYHGKVISGNVVANSYGENTNQHTFTIQDETTKYKVKGRNLYNSLLEHKPGEESLKISK